MQSIYALFLIATFNLATCQNNDNLLPKPGVCGQVKYPKDASTIKTEIGEHPWVVSIGFQSEQNNVTKYYCSGVLISKRYVLATGSCAKNKRFKLTEILLGKWNIKMDIDCMNDICADHSIVIPVEDVISDYNEKTKLDDIALIRLSQDVPFSEWIAPACLPTDLKLHDSGENSTLTVLGWGRTEEALTSDIKLKRNVSVSNPELCKTIYLDTNVEIHSSKQICTEPNIAPCAGDGPLMAISYAEKEKPYWYVAGISSLGPKNCGSSGWPNVNTRVLAYIDWIIKNIRP